MYRFLLALVVGGLVGLLVGWGLKAYLEQTTLGEGSPSEEVAPEASGVMVTPPEAVDAAAREDTPASPEMGRLPGEDPPPQVEFVEDLPMQYARAVRDGNWDWVIDHTLWMQERLARVRRQSSSADALDEARMALAADLSNRDVAGNQLRMEGVPDQYVFVPGCTLAQVGVDEGAAGLAAPVAQRTWIQVTYPQRNRALRDSKNIALQSVTVGVNASADGYILKANVLGNLEIDESSLKYWPD